MTNDDNYLTRRNLGASNQDVKNASTLEISPKDPIGKNDEHLGKYCTLSN